MFGKIQKKIKGVRNVSEGEEIDLGDVTLKVLETPGHSKGSISFHIEDEKALFSGDVVFTDGGVGRWDLPGGDLKTLMNTISRFLEMDLVALYPGHGPYTHKYGHTHIEKGMGSLKLYARFG
jgi:glyoxylase-like metal-dependent hydrolase (beta-lactamase superfamily II)